MELYWLLLIIVLVIIEVMTVNLTTIWFAIGGIFSLITSLFIDNVIIQLWIFILISIVSLIITRPFIKKITKNKVSTNFDRIINELGIVQDDITESNRGSVKVDGKIWTAVSDENLKKGDKVRILSIDGVKLKVKKESV